MKIAVISKNRCNFDDIETYARPLLYQDMDDTIRRSIKQNFNDYIWKSIEQYIDFIEIDNTDELINIACSKMITCFPDKDNGQFFYHSESSYSDSKKFIEIIHCQPLWNEYQLNQLENMNNIGCLMSLKHHVIENTCIAIANNYDLNSNKFLKITGIEKSDIIKTIRRRYFFSAVVIRENKISKIYYQDPKYLLMEVYKLKSDDKIEKLNISFLKYNLTFYFRYDKTSYINKTATRLNGLYRLYGDVVIIHELEDGVFGDITRSEINKLELLAYGRLYDREPKQHELCLIPETTTNEKGEQQEKLVVALWSKYLVVKNRMLTYVKNKCINCGEIANKPKICSRCYRAIYCSEICRREFSDYHHDECVAFKS